MSTPYFYIIQEKATGKYYAGSRTAKNCHPRDLLSSYHTSSKVVSEKISQGSEFIIRKIRVRPDALEYETRFLQRVKAGRNKSFINKHANEGRKLCPANRKGRGPKHDFNGEMLTKAEFLSKYRCEWKTMKRYLETGTFHDKMTNDEWMDYDTRIAIRKSWRKGDGNPNSLARRKKCINIEQR